jgi:uncharacterized protein (DUF305 family)
MGTSSKYGRLLLLALVVIVALALASCGGSGGAGGGMEGMDHGGEQAAKNTEGKAESKAEGKEGMKGMDHGRMNHGSGDMASGMVMENGKYSDRAFIDAMVPHHQGAVDMAQVALDNAEHREVKALAENIVSAQEAEIEELRSIKEEEYGSSEVPTKMSAGQMEAMGMAIGPKELAKQEPFDKAFIDNMISHHESAIEMAEVALEKSDNPKIREIARAIVAAQEREIARMEGWRKEWYPEG